MLKSVMLSVAIMTASVTPSLADGGIAMCKQIGSLAETIMDIRQKGATMSFVMEEMIKASPDLEGFLRGMIKQAYAVPLYGSDEYQAMAKIQFRDTFELACFSSDIGSAASGDENA